MVEPDNLNKKQIFLDETKSNLSPQECLNYFLSLFQTKIEPKYVMELQNKFTLTNIQVKKVDRFDSPEFYKILLMDMLYNLHNRTQLLEQNLKQAEPLTSIFRLMIPKITLEISQYREIKFCFSLFYMFGNFERTQRECMDLLSNIICCLLDQKPGIFLEGIDADITTIIAEFYQSIYWFVNQKIDKEIMDLQQLKVKDTAISEEEIKEHNLKKNRVALKTSENSLSCRQYIKEQDKKAEFMKVKRDKIIIHKKQKTSQETVKPAVKQSVETTDKKTSQDEILDQHKLNLLNFGQITSLETLNQFLTQFFIYTKIDKDDFKAFQNYYLTDIGNNSHKCLWLGIIRSYSEYYVFTKNVQKHSLVSSKDFKVLNKLIEQMCLSEMDYSEEIRQIINDEEYIQLFISIMKSKVVKEYYTGTFSELHSIQNVYASKIETFPFQNYTNEEIKQYINNILIIMPLNQGAKGITTSFLRAAINPKWLDISTKTNDDADFGSLLVAYVLLAIFHESNHFLRRYYNQDSYEYEVETPGREGEKQDGGELMFEKIFGVKCINEIQLNQAIELLDLDNWDSIGALKKIIKQKQKEASSIRFMTTTNCDDKKSFCVIRHYNEDYNSIPFQKN